MLGLHHLSMFLIASTMIIVVPGPATVFVVELACFSRTRAIEAILGIVTGDIMLMLLSALGVAALLTHWPNLSTAVKCGGTLYLGYLGLSLIFKAGAESHSLAAAKSRADYRHGCLITLTNPKPILFFAAFFPLFVDSRAGVQMMSYGVLGGTFELINVIYFSLVCLLVGLMQRSVRLTFVTRGRLRRLSGAVLCLCAVLIGATLFK